MPYYTLYRWYHPHITRNLAEAELQEAEEGVYLMRPRLQKNNTKLLKGFAIDVRYIMPISSTILYTLPCDNQTVHAVRVVDPNYWIKSIS